MLEIIVIVCGIEQRSCRTSCYKTLHFRSHFLFELAPRSIRVEQGRSSFLC